MGKDKFSMCRLSYEALFKIVYARDNGRCGVCGGQGTTLAHRVAKTKANIRKAGRLLAKEAGILDFTTYDVDNWGVYVINHPDNLALCCNRFLTILLST